MFRPVDSRQSLFLVTLSESEGSGVVDAPLPGFFASLRMTEGERDRYVQTGR